MVSSSPATFKSVINEDFSKASILVRTNLSGSRRVEDTLDRIRLHVAEHFPAELPVNLTGTLVLLTGTTSDIVAGQIKSLTLALGIIFLVMTAMFLSAKIGFFAILPNVVPIVIFFGVMGWLGIYLNLGTSLIAAIALGIAVDSTIHYMARLNLELRGETDQVAALVRTVRTVGVPIVYTTVALFLGFLTFAFSSFVPIQNFGILTAFTMAAALGANLVLLPALLATTKVQNLAKEHRRRKDECAAAEALAAVKEKYRRVCRNWHRHGVAVHCGYMIGFPFDGPESGRQSAEWLLDVGVDLASFFVVTPLPGTEDHDKAVREGTIADWDFNQYDSQHMVSEHPRMTREQVVQAYRDAYLTFYSTRNTLRALLTYHGVEGLSPEARSAMVRQRLYYFYSYRVGRHPMLGGLWQRSVPPDARRRVVSDEEARAEYLGGGIVSAEGVRLALPA